MRGTSQFHLHIIIRCFIYLFLVPIKTGCPEMLSYSFKIFQINRRTIIPIQFILSYTVRKAVLGDSLNSSFNFSFSLECNELCINTDILLIQRVSRICTCIELIENKPDEEHQVFWSDRVFCLHQFPFQFGDLEFWTGRFGWRSNELTRASELYSSAKLLEGWFSKTHWSDVC